MLVLCLLNNSGNQSTENVGTETPIDDDGSGTPSLNYDEIQIPIVQLKNYKLPDESMPWNDKLYKVYCDIDIVQRIKKHRLGGV